jgi:hypothetical protein
MDLCEYKLGYTVAVIIGKGFGTVVNQYDLDFAPVVGVYGSGAVKHGNAVFGRKT